MTNRFMLFFTMPDPSAHSPQSVLDREAALSRVGGDGELLHEIAQIFLEDYPRSLAEIREAAVRGDVRTVERTAHGLKGAAANFGARPVVDAALAIEEMGHQQDLDGFPAALSALEQALTRFKDELQDL